MSENHIICDVCFRHCRLADGAFGACRARKNEGGKVVSANYGRITSIALDPIEKKPLAQFHPGSMILSVGSFGCNLTCPFCQNDSISYADSSSARTEYVSPEELVETALSLRNRGNIGIAYTYNEALVGWEYVRDCARLAHAAGLVNVLVTNGCAGRPVLEELLPYIDAMNIDLKSFRPEVYAETLGGDLAMVKHFIARAAASCHVELTTLIVPGMNDSEDEMEAEAAWIAGLSLVNGARGSGAEIPLHISRFFPRHDYTDRPPTPVETVYRLCAVARRYLRHVYPGNC